MHKSYLFRFKNKLTYKILIARLIDKGIHLISNYRKNKIRTFMFQELQARLQIMDTLWTLKLLNLSFWLVEDLTLILLSN